MEQMMAYVCRSTQTQAVTRERRPKKDAPTGKGKEKSLAVQLLARRVDVSGGSPCVRSLVSRGGDSRS